MVHNSCMTRPLTLTYSLWLNEFELYFEELLLTLAALFDCHVFGVPFKNTQNFHSCLFSYLGKYLVLKLTEDVKT